MKALVKAKAEPGLWLEDVPVPDVGPDDVLVQVHRAGICGSDLHIEAWDDVAAAHVAVPLVIGHEFVGEVVEVGDRVHGFAAGDIVSGEGHLVCGQCRSCLAGRRHHCARTVGLGVQRPGAFAEYVALPAGNLWKHAALIDLDVAAVFDPFGNAVHTALTFPLVGENVLITGAGPIGLMAAMVARHAGARNVVVSDVNPYRLDLARRVGVTAAVNVSEQPIAEVARQLGADEGFDVTLEMSGSQAALRDVLANTRHGGHIAMLGLPMQEFGIDLTQLVMKGLTLKGIYGRQIFETWHQMSGLVESGMDIKPLITHRFAADDFQAAFDTARSGDCGKVVLSWTER